MKKKYKTSVYIKTIASKYIGEVEFDSIEEYYDLAEKLWEDKGYDSPTSNIHNDFDLGDDWDIIKIDETFLEYCKNE